MSSNGAREAVLRTFQQRYAAPPHFLARAPGRVNLIGEHTDYNEGFVLPLAIDRAVWIALRPVRAPRVSVYSQDFQQQAAFELTDGNHGRAGWNHDGGDWIEYMRGVAWALRESGRELSAWEGVTAGDVPIGAGLSSSAALELATARAFAAVSDFAWDGREMARIAQRAENEWVGVNCGIMDQMISAAGEAGHALLIDCRSLEFRKVPLPETTVVVILDTATRRGLLDSAYNERRAHCEAAARFLGLRSLRDVGPAEFEARAGSMDEVARKRARHVVTENERTLAAAAALQDGDAHRAGQLMNASHESLRSDFEVSRPELDVMAEIARRQAGCHGARMTGAGFGGCAVALVAKANAAQFARDVEREYSAATGLAPKIYVCSASQGASVSSVAW